MLITDGAYAGEENTKLASGKNIRLMTVGLLGRKPREILGEFQVNGAGTQITGCPYQNQCNPAIKERTAVVMVPLKSRIV